MSRPRRPGGVTAACVPEPDDVILWADDFEACDDLCGWTVSGDARRVTTYHPGEHALRLGPGAVARHPLQIDREAVPANFGAPAQSGTDGNWLELSTDCVGRGARELRALGEDRLAIEVALAARGPGRFARHRVNFPPLDPARAVVFVELGAGRYLRF